jgi:hypothetical protein
MANNQPEEDAEQWCHMSLISRVEEVPQDMQFLSHPCVGDTQGYDIHTQQSWMLCRKPWLLNTEEFGLKLQQMRNEKDAKQWRRRSLIS